MVPGDTYGINGELMRGHIFVYLTDYMEFNVFYSIIDSKLYKVKRIIIDSIKNQVTQLPRFPGSSVHDAIQNAVHRPVFEDINVFDFIESLPKDVFEVIYVNYIKKISEAIEVSLI